MKPKPGSAFDAAPFGIPLTDDLGLKWEDPREVHRVVVRFEGAAPEDLRLEYWRTRWPEQRLPKEAIPEGGGFGWWELGNWYTGTWQAADTERVVEGNTVTFTFRPLNECEFTDLVDFPATYRTTLKIRLVAEGALPEVEGLGVYTDSVWEEFAATVLFSAPPRKPSFDAFNGHLVSVKAAAPGRYAVTLRATANPDPNTFDQTLLTVHAEETVTVAVDDLRRAPVCVPAYGTAVVAGDAERDYASVYAECLAGGKIGIHDAVSALPEQTWARAWSHMVPKRERIYLPVGADGGRHRFGVNPNGSVFFRTNNHLLIGCPGRDSDRLKQDKDRLAILFGLPARPAERTIEDGVLPIGITTWQIGSIRVEQTAFATVLEGTDPNGGPPPADAMGVLMARVRFANGADQAAVAHLDFRVTTGEGREFVTLGEGGEVYAEGKLRLIVETGGKGRLVASPLAAEAEASPLALAEPSPLAPLPGGEGKGEAVHYSVELAAGGAQEVIVKIPYLAAEGEEVAQLRALDFVTERKAVGDYWRRRLDEGMKLTTPEPILNEYHRAHTGHLLVNCELEPGAARRFARVGSFGYAAFGNESCMMIVDLDRRGYHREARECLEAFLEYQGTVPLPGDYSSQEGILYGAHGYEHGGYNQHHGWILWCLVEHYRFTRDAEWLARIAPNLIAASDWIARERARTLTPCSPDPHPHPLSQWERGARGEAAAVSGLLPFGSLEDVGDWWQWMSTNLYSWRGIDAAAWGLEQIGHPEAARVGAEADDYRAVILRAFTEAARRSPVVRLRNGTWVRHFPSEPHRRGRAFGWICETLEGALHLLITRILPADSPEALWIMSDYEDNLYNSGHYGYAIPDYDQHWFDWGGFSMQACLLFSPEPYLYRDEIPHALRAVFNAMAANFFPDTRMMAEHALPALGDFRGDHYKTSDEANATGWLRHLFVREEGEELLIGQAIPREWLTPGNRIGVENAATYFGPVSVTYEAEKRAITAKISGPRRNPPARIRARFRAPAGKAVRSVTVNGKRRKCEGEWVELAGDVGEVEVRARLT
jgi:hypothetical protein